MRPVNSQIMVQKESCSFSFFGCSVFGKFDGKAAFMSCFALRDLLRQTRRRKICYTRRPYFHMSSTGNAEEPSAISYQPSGKSVYALHSNSRWRKHDKGSHGNFGN